MTDMIFYLKHIILEYLSVCSIADCWSIETHKTSGIVHSDIFHSVERSNPKLLSNNISFDWTNNKVNMFPQSV